ncbi:MAG: hypothetical protein KJ018_05495 [Burkholderiales bacterium]|nr:hypothetical protein [Burkholderiales bacterium]
MPTVKKLDRTFWHKEATGILRAEMGRRDMGYKELVHALGKMGIVENQKRLSNKVARGTFSFQFFLQCMYALGHRDDVRILLDPLPPEWQPKERGRSGIAK